MKTKGEGEAMDFSHYTDTLYYSHETFHHLKLFRDLLRHISLVDLDLWSMSESCTEHQEILLCILVVVEKNCGLFDHQTLYLIV